MRHLRVGICVVGMMLGLLTMARAESLRVDQAGIWLLLDDCVRQDARSAECAQVDRLRQESHTFPQVSSQGALKLSSRDLDELQRTLDGKLKVQLQDPPCLAQMEAAMRAMDPFIDPSEDGSVSSVQDVFKDHDLWQQVKRDCWVPP